MKTMIDVRYENHMGDDLTVVNAAKVSFGKRSKLECIDMQKGVWKMSDKDEGLIHYLGTHKHMSPFGHCFASFHVKAPIFVARQLVKHKFLRWNEISRRYVDEEPKLYWPEILRNKAENIKQGSEGVNDKWNHGVGTGYYGELKDKVLGMVDTYNRMIKDKVAPEQARVFLPANTMTEWWWSGSLDAFAGMCNLRCKPDAQYETRIVADMIDKRMADLFPLSWEVLRE